MKKLKYLQISNKAKREVLQLEEKQEVLTYLGKQKRRKRNIKLSINLLLLRKLKHLIKTIP